MTRYSAPEFVDVTDIPLALLVRAAYKFSVPKGLGFLHATAGDLSQEDADQIVADAAAHRQTWPGAPALSLDYVHGRACKFTVWEENGARFFRRLWYDHTPAQTDAMLAYCYAELARVSA